MDEAPGDILKTISEKVNQEDTFSQRIGVKLMELLPGFARTTLPITLETVNIHQKAHGGAIFSVADQACQAAGNSFAEPAVALQQNIHFLAAGRSRDFLGGTPKAGDRAKAPGVSE